MSLPGLARPVVSVVMATYNRSNILRHAIGSLRSGSFTEWELVVVGDCCTDDTAAVVASFADPRIRFVNRHTNHGEQSVPNNEGCALARGDLIAFLNHDDFWFPDHLQVLVRAIHQTGADLVYSLGAARRTDGSYTAVVRDEPHRANTFVPCSGWLLRRSLHQKLGGWRCAYDLFGWSSADFLFRAWKSGATLVPVRTLTWLVIYSGDRPNSYASRLAHEHTEVGAQIAQTDALRGQIVAALAAEAASSGWNLRRPGEFRRIARFYAGRAMASLLIAFRQSPHEWRGRVLLRSRGAAIRQLRIVRGLESRPPSVDDPH